MINHDLYQPPDLPKPYEYFLAMIEQMEKEAVFLQEEIAKWQTDKNYPPWHCVNRDTRILKRTRRQIGAYKTHLRRTENLARRTE